MGCSTYFPITIPACPPYIVVNGGLLPNTRYRWEITDKFGILYTGLTDTDATGLLGIVVDGNEDLPPGLFMAFSGTFVLRVYLYVNPFLVEPQNFVINEEEFEAIELTFKLVKSPASYFDPEAPVYITVSNVTTEVPFEDQASVIITHNLGYKPFVQALNGSNQVINYTVTQKVLVYLAP